MFEKILKLIRGEEPDTPPTAAAVAEALDDAKTEVRALAERGEELVDSRVDLVLQGDDEALDELEREIELNTRRIAQGEALIIGLGERLEQAKERETQAALDADLAAAAALREEYAGLLDQVEGLFADAIPALSRMAAIATETRDLKLRIGTRAPAAATMHPNLVLRPGSEPLEETAVLPPIQRGGPSHCRDRREWFRPELKLPSDSESSGASGPSRPFGAYDENGDPIRDSRFHAGRAAG